MPFPRIPLQRLVPRRLPHRLALLFALLMVAALAIHSFIMDRELATFASRLLRQHAQALANGISGGADTLHVGERDRIEARLRAAGRGGVMSLAVTDAAGQVRGALRREYGGQLRADPTPVLGIPDGKTGTRPDPASGDDGTVVAWSAIDGDPGHGWVRVEVSGTADRELRLDIGRDSAALGAIMVLFAAIVVLAILRRPTASPRETAESALAPNAASGHVMTAGAGGPGFNPLRAAVDRSSRPLAGQEPAAGEDTLYGVLDNLSELVFRIDTAGRLAYLNPAWERITQHAVGQALGRTALDFVPAEDQDDCLAAFQALVSGERDSLRQVLRLRARDGSLRWTEASVRALRDETGRCLGLEGSAADVTERHLAQEHLQDQVRFVHQLIEAIATPVYLKDVEGRYLGFNKAFAEFFRVRRRDFLGKTVFELLPPDIAQWHHERDRTLIAEGGVQSFEARVIDADGKERDTIYRKATYARRDGAVAGIVGVITDISERKLFERELVSAKVAAEIASQAKDEFLSNMSHELRTPMNAIIGLTDLTLETRLDAEQREYMTQVSESSRALLAIIDDILDYTRIDAGRLQFDHVAFNLRECVGMAVTATSARAAAKGLALHCSIRDAVPEAITGDPIRLRQVLLKLLDNAVKFTEVGSVALNVAVEGGGGSRRLGFTISDTGIGIAPGKVDMIFDAFSQADSSSTRRHGGTGLGLAISARLVEGMGGKIGVESMPGVGSSFHFSLPLATPAEPQDGAAAVSPTAHESQRADAASPAAEISAGDDPDRPCPDSAPNPAQQDERPAFDLDAVLENLGGDTEIFHAVARSFVDSHGASLAQLRQAVAAGDWDAGYRAAHALKGAAGNFAAAAVVEAALAVERAARRGDARETTSAARCLEARIRDLARALREALESEAAAA